MLIESREGSLGFFSNSKTIRPLIKFLSPGRRKIAFRRPLVAMAALGIFFSDLSSSSSWSWRKKRERKREKRARLPRETNGDERRKELLARGPPRRLNVLNNGKIYQATPSVFPKKHPSSLLSPFCYRASFEASSSNALRFLRWTSSMAIAHGEIGFANGTIIERESWNNYGGIHG